MRLAGKDYFMSGDFTVPAGVTTIFVTTQQSKLATPAWDMANGNSVGAIAAIDVGVHRNFIPFAWGDNTNGKLGIFSIINASIPTMLVDATTNSGPGTYYRNVQTTLNNTTWYSAYTDHTAQNAFYNRQYSAGAHASLNLNLNTPASNASSPLLMTGGNLRGIFRNNNYGFLMGIENAPRGWGDNTYGQLGINSTTNQTTPTLSTRVSGSPNIINFWPCNDHLYGLTAQGDVLAWGRNDFGQLGLGDVANRSSPVLFASATNNPWKKFVGTGQSTIGLKVDGTVWVWGQSSMVTQYAVGGLSNVSTPVQVPNLEGIVDIRANNMTTTNNMVMALTRDGRVLNWGTNTFGYLGDNTITSKSIPQLMVSDASIVGIGCGERQTAYLKSDGSMWMCGNNSQGTLGDGTLTNRSVPVKVVDTISYLSRTFKIRFVKALEYQAAPVAITVVPGQTYTVSTQANSFSYSTDIYCANGVIWTGGAKAVRIAWFE